MGYDIDFVLTWVDGSDRAWQQSKEQRIKECGYSENEIDVSVNRYRDMGLLKYWFRAVETYAPWVHRIYLVTNGQIPEFLNQGSSKVAVINQSDIMPDECAPCFNSTAVELYFHRIPGIAEHFVYFNDDFMLNAPVEPEDYFQDGKPVDILAFQPVIANPSNEIMTHLYINNSLLLARHFDKLSNMKSHRADFLHIGYPVRFLGYNFLEQLFPQITGFYTAHRPYPLLKSVYEKVWGAERECLYQSSLNPFRSERNLTFYVMSEWNKMEGNFVPYNIEKKYRYFELDDENADLFRAISSGRTKEIIINDTGKVGDWELVCDRLREIYELKLPNQSEYEIRLTDCADK